MKSPQPRPELVAACEKLRIAYPEELPITRHVEEIKEAWKNHQVIVVAGDTGSGKTTQLPKIALDLGFGRAGRIGCTQPRRLAASAMARRAAQELGCELGHEVGYQVRFDDRTVKDTALKFMLMRATNNVQQIKVVKPMYLNVFDILNADKIIISEKALPIISEWLSKVEK